MIAIVVAFHVNTVLATDSPPGITISVAQESVRIGQAVLCSSDALAAALESEPRTIQVTIELEPNVPFELFTRVTGKLRALGFEHLQVVGSIEPGWTLYPPPTDFLIEGCDESEYNGPGHSGDDR